MGLSQHGREEIRERRRRVDLIRTREPTITQAEIARRLDVSRATITRDVRHLREDRQKHHAHEMEAARADVLHRLDHVAEAAWRGWTRSTKRIEERRVRQKETLSQSGDLRVGPDGIRTSSRTDSAPVERTVDVLVKEELGDPRFLHILLAIERERAKLHGLYDVQQAEDTGKVRRLADAIAEVAEAVHWERYDQDLIAETPDAAAPASR
jgi:hypothetical protein